MAVPRVGLVSGRFLLVTGLFAAVLWVLLAMPYTAISSPDLDRDGDGLPDAEEDYYASLLSAIPIWQHSSDGCGPGHVTCFAGIPDVPGPRGLLCYDVVDIGYADLLAIEFSFFTDRNCTPVSQHWWNPEGCTVLFRRCPSCEHEVQILSVQTIGHQHTDWETQDRLYTHEEDKYWSDGMLMADGSHAMYVHLWDCNHPATEGCNRGTEIRNRFILSPFDMTPCHWCPDWRTDPHCLTEHITNPDCWAKRLYHLAEQAATGGCYGGFHIPDKSREWTADTLGIGFLQDERKQIPPFVPLEVSLPEGLQYVSFFREPYCSVEDRYLDDVTKENFGDVLVASKMPLRVINHPYWNWWEQMYDPDFQQKLLDEGENFGLRRKLYRYEYWSGDRDEAVLFVANEDDPDPGRCYISSLILRGLPGTVLVLRHCSRAGVLVPWHTDGQLTVVVPDGAREVRKNDLTDVNGENWDNKINFVTWGFGPLADAGMDMPIECRESVTLDGSGSFEFAPDSTTLAEVFRLYNFDYTSNWEYRWYDETNGDRLLGDEYLVTVNDLEVGGHQIRLEVSGNRYIVPEDTYVGDVPSGVPAVVADWCSVYVDIGAPVGIVRGVVKEADVGRYGVTVVATSKDGCSVHQEKYHDHAERSACTDEQGFFEIDSLCVGEHEVRVVTPLGFLAEPEMQNAVIAYTCWPEPDTVNFSLEKMDIVPAQTSMGFWKHQVDAHLLGRGKPQVSAEELSRYLNLTRVHFNENCANPIMVFEVPQPATWTDSLEVLRGMLKISGGKRMNDRAKQQLIALILNVASLKIHQDEPISEDGATVGMAVHYCYQLIMDGDERNDETAKDIADSINNGKIVKSGMIPLEIPATLFSGEQVESAGVPDDTSTKSVAIRSYPNPSATGAIIDLDLDAEQRVWLDVYDVSGKLVRTLFSGEFLAQGRTLQYWDGTNNQGFGVSPGTYFLRLRIGERTQTTKAIVTR